MPKSSDKEDMIAGTIRDWIIGGKLRPGVQLPTYESLEKEFSSSRMTMNKAISRLKDDGFLTGVERKGVFVAERPPYLDRVALLLATTGRLSRFMNCLENSAKDIIQSSGREIAIFPNLNFMHFSSAEAKLLKRQVNSRTLAGLIVTFDPDACPDQEIFANTLPKVFLSPGLKVNDGTELSMDNETFVRKALARLKETGAKRIAVLSFPKANPSIDHASRLMDEYGLLSKPEWQIRMDNPEIATQIVRLMLSADKDRRPDGLLLLDDHLTEHAAKGIVSEGIKVPDELKVLSHCNWEMPPSRPFPIELLGYDSSIVLRLGLKAIDNANKGIKSSVPLMVHPLFENERTSHLKGLE